MPFEKSDAENSTFVSMKTRLAYAYPFNGCYRLVGGHLTVTQNTSSRSLLHNGSGGLTTDESDYGLISSRGTWMRVAGNAQYRTYLSMPWGDVRDAIMSFNFSTGMDSFAGLNMSYWFSECKHDGFFVSGWEHTHPTSIYLLFHNCSGVTTLDLTGFDSSTIKDWGYAFSDMTALTTIKVDSTWELPSGLSSFNKSQRSYGCKNLVGGNGTAFDGSKVSADMAVIDTADTHGYLTAG